jgi:hypothetical protein
MLTAAGSWISGGWVADAECGCFAGTSLHAVKTKMVPNANGIKRFKMNAENMVKFSKSGVGRIGKKRWNKFK